MLKVIDIDNPKWNEIVKSFDNYGVHYLKEYVLAFSNHGDGQPLLFYYEGNNTRALNVSMKRDVNSNSLFDGFVNNNTYYDLSTPYGYGGWIFDKQKDESVYLEYIDWCKKNNIVCEFVRFNLYDKDEDYYGEVVPRVLNVVRNLQLPIEQIQADYERRVRKDLKKTNDLQIIIDKQGKYLDDFLRVYYATMNRNNAEDAYYFDRSFFETINSMKDNYVYFHVLFDEKIISTELVLMDNNNMYSYLGGTDSDYYDRHPNHYIKDEIIKWGVNNNYKNFVLGGGYGTNDGIFLFKKGFAPEGIVQFYTGQNVFNQEIYDKLVEYRKEKGLNVEGNKYFPLYRAQ